MEQENSLFFEEFMRRLKTLDGVTYDVTWWEQGQFTTERVTPHARCGNIYSITKVYTVTALGFLVDQGKLDIDEKAFPILERYFPAGYDPKWHEVTVCDIMRHRWGIGQQGFLDIDCKGLNEQPTEDFLSYVLAQPLTEVIGENHVYTDAAYYLLSRIFTERSGEMMDDFLRRELFTPLQYQEYAFATCPQGYPMGATGLYVSSLDIAKLGVLYLQKGQWAGRQIISEDYVKTVLERELELASWGERGGYVKGGMYCQLLYINPRTQRAMGLQCHQVDTPSVQAIINDLDL